MAAKRVFIILYARAHQRDYKNAFKTHLDKRINNSTDKCSKVVGFVGTYQHH